MAGTVRVVIPTYKRPQHLRRLVAEIEATPNAKALFVAHETDLETIFTLDDLGADYILDRQPPSGVNASNAGVRAVRTAWLVLSQDDVRHHPGWLERALEAQKRSGAKVVGLYDGFADHLASEHSVCWLINRTHLKTEGLAIGYPGYAFNPEYKKNYADNELNDTAKYRGVWAFAADSLVEHLHPGFGKGNLDETYTHTEVFSGQDLDLYSHRKGLFGK